MIQKESGKGFSPNRCVAVKFWPEPAGGRAGEQLEGGENGSGMRVEVHAMKKKEEADATRSPRRSR
jgi:hypothetical protein